MASIGSLVVEMSANVASLKSDLDKGRREFRSFSSDVTRQFATVEKAARGLRAGLATFGIGVGLRELVQFGSKAFEAAAGLGEMAQQMGITTDLLQVMQYAAVQSGVSVDELQGSFAKFTRTIGEAADGNKAAIDTFNELGVGVLDAQNRIRPTGALYEEVTAKLAAIPDAAKRATIEVGLFGRAGQKLDPIFTGGKEKLADYRKEMDDLGINLSGETIDAMDKASDKLSTLGLVAERMAAKLISDVLPDIQEFARTTKMEFDAIGKAGGDFLRNLPGWLNKGAYLLGLDDQLRTSFAERQDELDAELAAEEKARGMGLSVAVTPPAPGGDGGGHNRPPAGGGGKTAADVIKDLRFEIDQLNRSPVAQDVFKALKAGGGIDLASQAGQTIEGLVVQLDRLKLKQDAANESFARGADLAAEQDEARKRASERAQELIATREGMVAGYGRELEQGRELVAALQEGQQAYAVTAKYQEIANRFREAGLPLYGDEIDKAHALAGALVDLDRIREVTDAMREFANTMQDDVVGAITGLVAGTEDLDTALNQILQDVARGMLDVLNKSSATGSVGESLFKYLVGDIPSIFAGGGDTGAQGFGALAGFAGGGRPPIGRASIVGEAGPELFVPDAAGTVVPQGILDRLGGAGDVINIDARGATRDMVPELMRQLGALRADHLRLRRDVGPMAVAAVGNERSRSTGYAKRFAGKGSMR